MDVRDWSVRRQLRNGNSAHSGTEIDSAPGAWPAGFPVCLEKKGPVQGLMAAPSAGEAEQWKEQELWSLRASELKRAPSDTRHVANLLVYLHFLICKMGMLVAVVDTQFTLFLSLYMSPLYHFVKSFRAHLSIEI